MSHYMFIISIQVLDGIIKATIYNSRFKYHWRYERVKLVHIHFFFQKGILLKENTVTSANAQNYHSLTTFYPGEEMALLAYLEIKFLAPIRANPKLPYRCRHGPAGIYH